MTESAPESAIPENCRHEYVKIIQRKIKGLERRLVATRAYLPVGFKPADLSHLSEGSFCFCTKCRKRLFPKRTQAEKLKARLAAQEAKLNPVIEESEVIETDSELLIDVEELVLEAADVEDIKADGVAIAEPVESCDVLSDEDI